MTDFINSIQCHNCKNNNSNNEYSLIEINMNYEMAELFSKIDKDNFYMLNIYLLFGLDGNCCFFNKLFNNKYPCSLLKKIIFFVKRLKISQQ